MKVLHVIDALGMGGGAEHSLAESLPLFQARGLQSTVVCLFPRVGGLQAKLRASGLPVTVLDASNFVSRVIALRRLIGQSQPDLIHATLFHACLTTRIAALGSGVPQINSVVNTSYADVRTRRLGVSAARLMLARLLDRLTARFLVERFHVLTKAVKRSVIEDLGIPADRIAVIPRGRSRERLGKWGHARRERVRRRMGVEDDRPIILNVGREDHQKGQIHLVRAVGEIRERYPSAIFWIAGRQGSASEEISHAIRAGAVDGAVHRLGHREDIPDLLCAADVFVFPSLYEGLGCALLEAMALRVPILATDVPAIREVLGGEPPSGLLVESGDEHALAQGVFRILDDQAFARWMTDRALERFEKRYVLDRVVTNMMDLYRSVVHLG